MRGGSPTPVVFAHASDLLGGGNKVLLRIIEHLDRSRFHPLSVVPGTGPVTEALQALNVPTITADLRPRASSHLTCAKTIAQVYVITRAWRSGLLHSNELVYRGASLCSGVRSRICHIHHPGLTASTLAWMVKRRPDLILTPTELVAEQVRSCVDSLGLSLELKVVGNPIDTTWFVPHADISKSRIQLQMDPSGSHVAMIGALAPHKGHLCLLKSARIVADHVPSVMFHVVGDSTGRGTTYERELHALVTKLALDKHVKFWGFVDDRTARDLLAASDIFVLPTVEEGFGMVLAEAQSCSVPVLTTNMRPLDEVVEDGRTGFLLPPNDHHSFASKILELLENHELRSRMGAAGRAHVVTKFDVRTYVSNMQCLYKELIE